MPEWIHPFTLEESSETIQRGKFEYFPLHPDASRHSEEFKLRLESCLVSFAMENGFSLLWIRFTDLLALYVKAGSDLETIVLDSLNNICDLDRSFGLRSFTKRPGEE